VVASLAGFAGSKPLKVVHVRRSIWPGQEQAPKTPNAIRVVDIPEVLARVLRPYVSRISGYLFATKERFLLQQRNVLRVLHARKPVGFDSFRRFRLTWLRKNSVPKDLERYWMGHAPEEIGDLYSNYEMMMWHFDKNGRSAWA
jgi:hypothetical protein